MSADVWLTIKIIEASENEGTIVTCRLISRKMLIYNNVLAGGFIYMFYYSVAPLAAAQHSSFKNYQCQRHESSSLKRRDISKHFQYLYMANECSSVCVVDVVDSISLWYP